MKPLPVLKTLTRATLCGALALLLPACTTTAAKKAMNKPNAENAYSAFGDKTGDDSKREAVKIDPIKPDSEPEQAITKLVEQLQKQEAAYAFSAEDQLRTWGMQQGNDKIVASKVRLLLKNPRIEVRAPALRLTILFGGKESVGDLIEALADTERGMRQEAFKALLTRAHRDFGFDPDGGEVARARSVERWRGWWQAQQRETAVQPPSVYEQNPPTEPKIIAPRQ